MCSFSRVALYTFLIFKAVLRCIDVKVVRTSLVGRLCLAGVASLGRIAGIDAYSL